MMASVLSSVCLYSGGLEVAVYLVGPLEGGTYCKELIGKCPGKGNCDPNSFLYISASWTLCARGPPNVTDNFETIYQNKSPML